MGEWRAQLGYALWELQQAGRVPRPELALKVIGIIGAAGLACFAWPPFNQGLPVSVFALAYTVNYAITLRLVRSYMHREQSLQRTLRSRDSCMELAAASGTAVPDDVRSGGGNLAGLLNAYCDGITPSLQQSLGLTRSKERMLLALRMALGVIGGLLLVWLITQLAPAMARSMFAGGHVGFLYFVYISAGLLVGWIGEQPATLFKATYLRSLIGLISSELICAHSNDSNQTDDVPLPVAYTEITTYEHQIGWIEVVPWFYGFFIILGLLIAAVCGTSVVQTWCIIAMWTMIAAVTLGFIDQRYILREWLAELKREASWTAQALDSLTPLARYSAPPPVADVKSVAWQMRDQQPTSMRTRAVLRRVVLAVVYAAVLWGAYIAYRAMLAPETAGWQNFAAAAGLGVLVLGAGWWITHIYGPYAALLELLQQRHSDAGKL